MSVPSSFSRRGFMGAVAAIGALPVLQACAPAAAPTDTPAPAKPAEAPKPTQAPAAPTAAAAPASPTAAATAAPAATQPAAAAATPTPAAAAKPAGPASGSMRFGIWLGAADNDMWKAVIHAFQDERAGIKVEFEPIARAQLVEKTTAALAGGDPWDVMGVTLADIGTFGRKKQLTDYTDYVKRDNVNTGEWFENILLHGRWPKNPSAPLYSMPWRFVGSAFYVNLTLLQKASLTAPKDGWTWNDLVDLATKVRNEKENVWGTSVPVTTMTEPFLMQAGGTEPLDAEQKKSLLLEPPAKEMFQFLHDLIHKHKVAPKPEELPQGQDLFASGKIGLHVNGNWAIPVYRQAKEFDWDVAPMPQHKSRGAYAGPDTVAIPANAKQKDLGWEYVKFISIQLKAQKIIATTGLPVIRSYATSDEFVNGESQKKPSNYRTTIRDLTQYARGWSFGPPGEAWGREWTAVVTEMFNGKRGVDDGVQELHRRVQAVLDRFWQENPA